MDEVSENTNKMLSYLDGLKQSLKEFGKLDIETGELEYPDEINRSSAFMMGNDPLANEGSGNGEGIQLRNKLEAVRFRIDSLISVDAPTSEIVAAGMKFETKLFVATEGGEK